MYAFSTMAILLLLCVVFFAQKLSWASAQPNIAGGFYQTIAPKSDGTVWAWGWNKHGQLGNGTNTNSNLPVRVNGLSGVTAIACGSAHTIILKSNGKVLAWGRNEQGELGNGCLTIGRSWSKSVRDLRFVIKREKRSEHCDRVIQYRQCTCKGTFG